MPYIIQGEPTYDRQLYTRDKYDYKYPNRLNLNPESDLHKELRTKIWERAIVARNEICKRFDYWREIDRNLTVYVPLKDEEERIQKKDPSKPVSIVFPYSYSMLEAILTYMSMAFIQDPIFQYEGVEDDDTIGAALMELVVRLHCNKNKVPLNIHTVFRDSTAYGIGATVPEWVKKYGRRPERKTISTESPMGIETVQKVGWGNRTLLFEGNALSNIDPYMLLLDPSVSISDIQKGEFIGWVERNNYLRLLADENEVDSSYFNVKYLKSKTNKRSILALDQDDRKKKFGGSTDLGKSTSLNTNNTDVIKMYITLIPREWKLSSSENPEKWYFELAADDIIIRCERAEHHHGMYPIAIAAPEYDGYSITPISRLEILYGLQHTLDFLFGSHISNVRKAINDMLVVDPYLVNIEDLKDPKPGKLIRLRRPAWGRGVERVVQQLQVNDITRLNISDSAYITQWMDRISGADQSMVGALRTGGPERLTSTEFEGTRGSAVSRLQRLAMIIGYQYFQDTGTMFATHTQQYMSKETYVRIAGRHADRLANIYGKGKENVRVTPYDLSVYYDLLMRDGSIPGGNFSRAWIDMFKTIGTDQELRREFDVVRIFMFIAHQLGAKNVEDFRRNLDQIKPEVMPDEKVQSEVQKGNLVPAGVQ